MMRLAVSPIPIGRTPGFLSRAIRRHAKKEAMTEGSTRLVQRRLATEASALHKSREADLKEVHNLLQLSASSPDGPAAPVVFKAADLIMEASIDSNNTGCTSGGGLSLMIESG